MLKNKSLFISIIMCFALFCLLLWGIIELVIINQNKMIATDGTYTSGYYTYTVTNGEATITDFDTSFTGALTIASALDGYPVVGIGDSAFQDCVGITDVVVPECITNFGSFIFWGCSNLKTARLPTHITEIPLRIFSSTALEYFYIPEGVTNIGSGAFSDCTSLKSITIPSTVTAIGYMTFVGCSGLTDVYVKIPEARTIDPLFPTPFNNITPTFWYLNQEASDGHASIFHDGTIGQSYTISTKTNIEGAGNIIYGGGIVYENEYLVLYATPNDGYIFDGWYLNNTCVSTNQYYELLARASNCEYVAKFSLNQSNVSFETNGGSSVSSINIINGEAYGTLPTPTRAGYNFAGWYKNSDLTGSAVSASDIVTTDHTLYAKWTPQNYTIALDPQSGSGGTASVIVAYLSEMPTATAPTRNGYTFGGYYTEINGGGTQYYTSTMASAKNYDLTQGITLYAKWTENPYSITIIASAGGQVTSEGGNYVLNSIVSVFAAPNAGKAFLYWVRASDNAQILDNPLNQVVAGNETYTAIFGSSLEGVGVASTKGGLAYVLGDDYDLLNEDDYVIFSTRQALTDYTFSHWEDMNGNNLGTEMSIRLKKSQVMNNLITAVYVQNTSENINDQTSN